MEYITLDKTKKGELIRVTSIYAEPDTKRRLSDLGISVGTNIENSFSPPWNDPTAYTLKDTVIALRKETASKIYGFRISENEV